jgi:carboxymethylenebutenolidase
MNQEIINLFDEYTHKPLTRSDFMTRLAKIAGGTAAAIAILPLLEVNYAHATTIAEDDEDITTEDITYEGDGSTMKAYLAKPKKISGKIGAVLVIHENRGLNPHIKDVTRRVAKAGYIALGVDALSPLGGTPANEDEARDLFAKLDAPKNINNFVKGFDYLRSLKESNGKTACVGFCWGGGLANQLAVNSPQLNASVAYYGRQADAVDVPKIKASLMLHFGGLDERVNAGIPAYETALKAAGI